MKYILYLLLNLSLGSLCAQDKGSELSRFSIRGNVGIPKFVSSEALRNSFSGVLTLDGNINCKLFSNFFVGVGYSFTTLKAQRHFRDQNINTVMQMQNGYLKLGYDKFFSDNGFTTISLNAGYNLNSYKGVVYKSDSLIGKYPTSFSSSFVEPQLGVYFIVDPNFAIGGHISYYYNFSQFNATYAGFDRWLDYTKISNKWNISSITIGFGFYYGLAKK